MSLLSKAIGDLESKVDTITTTLLATDEFARVANSANSLSIRLKKGMSDQLGRRMALLNVPSRDDIVALGERLMTMDERLVRIEKALSRLVPPDPAVIPAGPPRTKKPPARTAAKTSPDGQAKKTATEKKPS
tara:strand:- start:2824 stop:3219 length:396 start_codon:yes stop_codon:yes gene_type:complete